MAMDRKKVSQELSRSDLLEHVNRAEPAREFGGTAYLPSGSGDYNANGGSA
jgi:hypothetical protein